MDILRGWLNVNNKTLLAYKHSRHIQEEYQLFLSNMQKIVENYFGVKVNKNSKLFKQSVSTYLSQEHAKQTIKKMLEENPKLALNPEEIINAIKNKNKESIK